MKIRTLVMYALVAILVAILGGLAGWYIFLRGQTQATSEASAARGFDASAPFGAPIGSTYQNMSGGLGGSPAGSTGKPLVQLWHADKAPVAGFAFTGSGSSTKLSFVERGSGYVFAADATTQTIERLTNTLMPKIYEALFTRSGGVIERSLDENGAITTFSGSVSTSTKSGTTTATTLSGAYMTKNIRSIAVSGATNELFVLEATASGVIGSKMQPDGSKKQTVFSSPIGDWRSWWTNDNRIILSLPAADGLEGHAYELRADGSLNALVGATPGLTVLPHPSSPALLYGASAGGGLSLFVQLNKEASSAGLPIQTVAEKCAWAPGKELVAYCAVPQVAPTGNFLDAWYKGMVHTADAWWRVDASSGKAQLIYAPEPSLALDVVDPIVDETGAYLAFKDGKDDSLWVLRLQK